MRVMVHGAIDNVEKYEFGEYKLVIVNYFNRNLLVLGLDEKKATFTFWQWSVGNLIRGECSVKDLVEILKVTDLPDLKEVIE